MAVDHAARDADIAPVAALIADPTRAAILTALLGGRALAAGELARLAGVSAATASAHLARLLDGGLVDVLRQGRHRYYRLAGHEVAARATAEQFGLFQRYQQARHGDGDMATMSFYDYRAMIEDTPIDTMVVEFRGARDELVGACLTDRLGDGLSAVYSFYAPGLDRLSIGTYTILWLVERARALGLAYVYLGYWVPESRKMAYKARFRPSEVLIGGQWRVLTDAESGSPADNKRSLVPETAG